MRLNGKHNNNNNTTVVELREEGDQVIGTKEVVVLAWAKRKRWQQLVAS